MRTELIKSEILFDIRKKSHSEVSEITDAEARYRAEAGTEKTDEIERDMITAMAMLEPTIGRYLEHDSTCYADNSAGLPEVIVFDFSMSPRRLDGKVQPLTDAIHAYIVDCTLALFYASVSQPNLQAKREKMAGVDLQLITHLIYTKRPPYMTRR